MTLLPTLLKRAQELSPTIEPYCWAVGYLDAVVCEAMKGKTDAEIGAALRGGIKLLHMEPTK